MPFTKTEQAAVERVCRTLDGIPTTSIPTVGGQALIPTGPEGARPDVFVPPVLADILNGLLAADQAAVWGMDPRDWTRELEKPALDRRWPSRMALTYMQACSAARRPLDVRHYWCYTWAMYDAGLLTVIQTPRAPNDSRWPAEQFRDATDVELTTRNRTREQANAYAAALARSVGGRGDFDYWSELRNDLARVGQFALDHGITGLPSESSGAWMVAHGVSGQALSEVAHAANLALYRFAQMGFGFTSPAHGWHAVCALSDGGTVSMAARTAYILAGYVDPDFITPETPPPNTPPPQSPGTGHGPLVGDVPEIDTPAGTTGGSGTGSGTDTKPDNGDTKPDDTKPGDGSAGTPDAPTKPTDPLDAGTPPGSAALAGIPPLAWLALGLGALALSRSTS